MGTGKRIEQFDIADVSKGCNYSDDITALTKEMSPDSMNVEFFNGRIRKRKGTQTFTHLNALYDSDTDYDDDKEYDGGISSAPANGNSVIDFSNTSGQHQQLAHIDTTVIAYDRLQDSSTVLRNNAPNTRSFNAKVKAWLIQTYADYSLPYYWDGSSASMSLLTNAPGFKRAIEFQGYLMGLGTSANPMRVYYQSTSDLLGAITAYTDYFTLTPGPNDDALTDPFLLNGRLYVGTNYSIFRISFVGGVTVFEFKQVISDIGIVPGTVQLVMTKEFGQVALFLGTDKRIYLFDGANVKTVSDLFYYHASSTTPIALDLIDDGYKENSFAVYDFTKRVYRLFVTRIGSSTNYYCMNVDVDTFAYYPFDNMEFSAGCMAYDDLLRPFVIAVDYYGQLHKLFVDVNTDNGEPINDYYISPLASSSAKDAYLKQAADIILHMKPTGGDLLVYDKVDFRRQWQLRQTLPCYSSRDKLLGQSFVLGSSVLGSEKDVVHPRISPNVTFNHYQFKLESADKSGSGWEIYEMSVNATTMVFGESEAQR